MSSVVIKSSVGRLPLGYSQNQVRLFYDMIRRMRVVIPGDGMIMGPSGVTPTTYNSGPWLTTDDSSNRAYRCWHAWNKDIAQYVPTRPNAYDSANKFTTFLDVEYGIPTANRTATFPDPLSSSKQIATLVDAKVPRETLFCTAPFPGDQILCLTLLSNDFIGQLHGNSGSTTTILGLDDMTEGQLITITLINNGTSWAVTWPGAVKWEGGVAPTQPVADVNAGQGIGIYYIQKIHSAFYGWFMDPSPITHTPSVDTGGNVPTHNYGGSGGIAAVNRISKLP